MTLADDLLVIKLVFSVKLMDKRLCLRFLVFALVIVVLILQPFSYLFSSSLSRLSLILAFVTLPALGFICQIKKEYFGKETIYVILFAISALFLFWRTGCFLPAYIEDILNTERFVLVEEYASSGHIQLSTGHSYFFLHSMVLYFLNQICSLSYAWSFWLALLLELLLIVIIGILIYEFMKKISINDVTLFTRILPVLVPFFFIAFINTNRLDHALLLVPLLLYLFFTKGIKHINHYLIGLLFVFGITFGSATGILFVVPFFFIYCLLNKSAKLSVYFLIPLAYLVFCTYSYTRALSSYLRTAWAGFSSFMDSALIGDVPNRVFPWGRGQNMMLFDTSILNAAYLSLFLLSTLLVLVLVFFNRETKNPTIGDRNSFYRASLIYLMMFILVAGVTYLGFSTLLESSISDVRAIVFVFMMIILPFIFVFKKAVYKIKSKKIISFIIVVLIFVASLQTIYSIYPKSANDPVNTVEDRRLDALSKLSTLDFLKMATPDSLIFLDYKLSLRAIDLKKEFKVFMLSTSHDINSADIIGVDFNGLRFGSLYVSPDIYDSVNNLTKINNVAYSSGDILIIIKLE